MRRRAGSAIAAMMVPLLAWGAMAQPAKPPPVPAAAASPLMVEVEALLERFFDEWRLFLTCSATEPETHAILVNWFGEEVEHGAAAMEEIGLGADFVAAFLEAANLDGFMMDAPFHEVVAFCGEHPDWPRQLALLDVIVLSSALEDIAEELGGA